MKKRSFTIYILMVFIFIVDISAQPIFQSGAEYCSHKKMNSGAVLTDDSPNTPKHTFDVLNYEFYLDIRSCFIAPYPKSFTGYVVVKFRVDTALNSINLNAVNSSLQIN